MRNYIWINHTRDRVLYELRQQGAYAVHVNWTDSLTIDDIRKFVNQSMSVAVTSTTPRAMVLNAGTLSPRLFTLFLKLLEQPDGLYISFYGARLNRYPLTVISRCTVRMRSSKEDVMERLTKLKMTHYFDEVQLLRHYDVETALRMIDFKPHFVDMLVRLEDFKPERYSSIRGFQNQPVEFLYLFYEWLNRNTLFAMVDLDRCQFLRDEETIRLLQEVSNCDPLFETYVIDLLFVRKAMMHAY